MRHRVTVRRNIENRETTSGSKILTKNRTACRAVIEDRMIPFAAYTAGPQQTRNAN